MRTEKIGERATLLVVDDDPVFRDLEAQILSHEGYDVLQAEGAEEALRLAGSTPTIDLLLTDFRMPEANGLELTRRFRTVHPQTPVLMVSGDLPSLRDQPEDPESFALLAKPFTLIQLVQKVRYLLEASAARTTDSTQALA